MPIGIALNFSFEKYLQGFGRHWLSVMLLGFFYLLCFILVIDLLLPLTLLPLFFFLFSLWTLRSGAPTPPHESNWTLVMRRRRDYLVMALRSLLCSHSHVLTFSLSLSLCRISWGWPAEMLAEAAVEALGMHWKKLYL